MNSELKIALLNGPNLNLLGRREPDIYGAEPFDTFLGRLRASYPHVKLEYFQSNSEGDLIDAIQKFGFMSGCRGIVINPGAYSHYSVAIADAIGAVPLPVVEVHISNIHAREEFRRHSVTATRAAGVLAGFGLDGYRMAIDYLLRNER